MSDPNIPPPPGGGTPPPPPPPPGGGAPPPPPPGGGTPPPPPGPPGGGGYGGPPQPPAPPGGGGFGGPPGGFTPPPAQPYGGGGERAQLDVGSSISYGWKKFTENVGPFIILMLAVLVIGFVLNVVRNIIVPADETGLGMLILGLFLSIVIYIITMIVQAGVYRAGLGVTKGVTPSVSQLTETENIATYILTSILVGLGTFIGLVLCIVPGIIFFIFAAYAPIIAIDKGLDPIESIKQSFSYVKENFGQVFLILLVAHIVYIIGVCLCGIGILVTAPVALVAIIYSYRALNNETVTP